MKTAMQEWFDELKANYPYMANDIYQKGFQKYLEKEKEQIKIAFESGWNWNSDPEKYYQETYNQEETLEEWKSKFTHHCAIKTNKNQ